MAAVTAAAAGRNAFYDSVDLGASNGYISLTDGSSEVMKFNLSDPAWQADSGGTKILNAATWVSTTGSASPITTAEFYDSDNVLRYSGSVGTASGVVIVPKTIWAAAEVGSISSGTAT